MSTLGESVSEVSQFIPEPRNFSKVTILPSDVKKAWLKETLIEIENIINDRTFLMDDPDKGDPVTPYIDVYKAKIQSDGSLDKLRLIMLVREDFQNK